jgi:hypothetical protein
MLPHHNSILADPVRSHADLKEANETPLKISSPLYPEIQVIE